jgi:uncharacterized protein involved in cysteine biosynthesis
MAVTKKSDGAFTRFFRGAGFFGKGWRFVLDQKGLWPWVIAPTLLTLAITVGGVWSSWAWGQAYIAARTAGHGAFYAAILKFFLFLFVVSVGYVAFLVTSLIAAAPFVGTLSERTEKLATGAAVVPHGFAHIVQEAARALGHTLLTLTLYLVFSSVLFLLQFFVAPLAPFVWVGSFFLTALFLGYDAWDLPLSRRGASFGEKWGYVGRHLAESLGFGAAVALLLAIPGFGLVVPAVAAVGGTLLHLDLEK